MEKLNFDEWYDLHFIQDPDHNYSVSKKEIEEGFNQRDLSRWRDEDILNEYENYLIDKSIL